MFHRLGRFTASHPWLICAVWIVSGLVLTAVAPRWDTRTHDDDIHFIPDRFTSVRAHHLMEEAFPEDVCGSRVIFALERDNTSLKEADFALVDAVVADLEQLRASAPELKLGRVDSYKNGLVAGRLTSNDRQCTLIQVSLDFPFLAIGTIGAVDRCQDVVRHRVSLAGADAPKWFTTGAACIGRDVNKAAGESLEGTTLATVILVIVVLLAVYRAPILALIPLATIATSVWVSLNVLALLTLIPGVHLVNISKIFAIVMLYGAGTDYCLFLISRYREALEAGHDTGSAIAESIAGVGNALSASACTVMVGLALMGFAEFGKVRYAGPGIALSLGIALAASLTLTPALLKLFGAKAFWPRRSPQPALGPRLPKLGLWDWISHGVVKRPVLVWTVAVATLVPLALIGLRVLPNYKATGELALRSDSLQGVAAIQRHFTPGEVGPITVLLASEVDWNGREGRLEIDHLSRGFASLDNVAEVRSLTQPLGTPLWDLTPKEDGSGLLHRLLVQYQPLIRSVQEEVTKTARRYFVADIGVARSERTLGRATPRFVTRLDVVLKSDPFEPASHETLRLIQAWLQIERPKTPLIDGPVRAECFGVTANAEDIATVTESDRHRINGLVILSIFLVLFLLVRRIWLAGYLLVTVLLSYFAALGATLLAASLWTGLPLTTLDWRVPFFLFTILVAVGEDYNIMLIARAFQEAKRFGKVEGMRRALAKTGGAITSCGLIMAGTFATLMLAGLGTLLQVGFALAFGVLIDTFIVRPFLVPAFTLMVWRFISPPSQAVEVEQIPEIDDEDLIFVEAA